MRLRVGCIALFMVSTGLALTPAQASAAGHNGSWTRPQLVDAGSRMYNIQRVVASDGTAVISRTRGQDRLFGCTRSFTSIRTSGATKWVDAPPFRQRAYEYVEHPQVSFPHEGASIAVVSRRCARPMIDVRWLVGAEWGPATKIRALGRGATSAMDSDGNVVVAWTVRHEDQGTQTLRASGVAADSHQVTSLLPLRVDNDSDLVYATLDDVGRVTAVFDNRDDTFAVDTLTDGSWSVETLELKPDALTRFYDIDSEPGGTIAIGVPGWEEGSPAEIDVWVRDRAAVSFGAPRILSSQANIYPYVGVATSTIGDVVVNWQEGQKGGAFAGIPTLERRDPSGEWGSALSLGHAHSEDITQVTRSDEGGTVVEISVNLQRRFLYSCTVDLTCSKTDLGPDLGYARNTDYTAGPGGSVVATGVVNLAHRDFLFMRLMASLFTPAGSAASP